MLFFFFLCQQESFLMDSGGRHRLYYYIPRFHLYKSEMLLLVISTGLWRLHLDLILGQDNTTLFSPWGNLVFLSGSTFSMLLWLLHLSPAQATPNTLLPHFQKECSVSENIDVLSSVPSADAPGPGMMLCPVARCSQPLQTVETWGFLPLLMNLPATSSSRSSRKNLCRSWMVGLPTPGAQIVWLCVYCFLGVHSFWYILLLLFSR